MSKSQNVTSHFRTSTEQSGAQSELGAAARSFRSSQVSYLHESMKLIVSKQHFASFHQSFSHAFVYFGAECIARVAGQDATVFHERPHEVAPHTPPIQECLEASGDWLLDSDQKQKRLDLIRNCVHSFVQTAHRKELDEDVLSVSKKRAEVHERTAEL